MRLLLSTLATLLLLNTTTAQLENSLLWKITGNGLTQPSYLYGTMHVSSKIAFRLDDVFYEALESADAVALESNPTLWMDNYYKAESRQLQNRSYSRDADFYSDLFKTPELRKETFNYNLRVAGELLNGYLYRKEARLDEFEEDTYLDMWIYQAGVKMDKPIISLEDLEESSRLVKKSGYNAYKEEPDAWLKELLEKSNYGSIMQQAYRDRNINLLDSLGAASNTPYNRQYMLFIRNENMVDAMERAMKTQSLFAGVGAAHLPGDKGMIALLRDRGYTVMAINSKKTAFSKNKKLALDQKQVGFTLSRKRTTDNFLSIKSFDKLREITSNYYTLYLMPEMTNGAYMSIMRLNHFEYLPDNEEISLDDVDNALFENIPGNIISKEKITTPYPGFNILSKSKKGHYLRSLIFKTPVEWILIKAGGKKDIIVNQGDEIINSIDLKKPTTAVNKYTDHGAKYTAEFPGVVVATNQVNAGNKLVQSFDKEGFYWLMETPVTDYDYIEEDKFEARYIVQRYLKNYDLIADSGSYITGKYQSYRAQVKLDDNSILYVQSVIKDGSYYLLGARSKAGEKATTFLDSFKFSKATQLPLQTVTDSTMFFTVKAVQPAPEKDGYNIKNKKSYDEYTRSNQYVTAANDIIKVEMKKFHNLQMFENPDSLWSQVDTWAGYNKRWKKKYLPVISKNDAVNNGIYTHQVIYGKENSAKHILVKNLYSRGKVYELSTIIDKKTGASPQVASFYETFIPQDTLIGSDVFTDKTDQFFLGIVLNDSIVHDAKDKLRFSKRHIPDMIRTLEADYSDDRRKKLQLYLLQELTKLDDDKVTQFLTNYYVRQYDEPEKQLEILEAVLHSGNKNAVDKTLALLEMDLPLKTSSLIRLLLRKKEERRSLVGLYPQLLEYAAINEYKTPVYKLLARLLDDKLIKKKDYRRYKDQIINDGRIEIKRGLSKTALRSTYRSNVTDVLPSYVKLIYPYRETRNGKDFFNKLILSENDDAIAAYYVLLSKNKEEIPQEITTLLNADEKLNATVQTALVPYSRDKVIDFKARSRNYILSRLRYDPETDELQFLDVKVIDDQDNITAIYIYKAITKQRSTSKERMHYVAYTRGDNKQLTEKRVAQSTSSGLTIDDNDEDTVDKIIRLVKFKDRKRVR